MQDSLSTKKYLTHRGFVCLTWLCCILLNPHTTINAQTTRANHTGVTYTNVARAAGITVQTIYGGEDKNKYLLETTGSGAAFLDYDDDGWQDIFLVGGTRLDVSPQTRNSTNRLYRNKRDGTFEDVTTKAGVADSGWGQSVSVADYDNDGHDDIFVSRFGKNLLYRNKGDGTFQEVAARAGVADNRTRWGAGTAFLDFNRDGLLDLFVASYIDLDLKTAPLPETGPCLYKGVMVACGPPGLAGGTNSLYMNRGDGTFQDVSEKSGIIKANGTYGLGVVVSDFDNDGWSDIYVANDSSPAALYHNNHDGTFTDIGIEAGSAFSIDGKPQAGMGVAAGDYDRDGFIDIFKTNFSGDTSSLYRNTTKPLTKNSDTKPDAKQTDVSDVTFDDVTFPAGLGLNTRWLGWGCGFLDFDNNGWLDIFLVNGHVYPEVGRLTTEAGYAQRKVMYRNLGNGKFEDVSEQIGGAIMQPTPARGCAFGDYDNDGDTDILINPVNAVPELLRADSTINNNWINIKTIGTKSNRNGIGARVICTMEDGATQTDEVRSGGSYYSSNDRRVHFGLGKAAKVKSIEVRWLGGGTDIVSDAAINQTIIIKQSSGAVKVSDHLRK
ncbi:MAG: CRTAC1 family protein [Pyrinomonadaceae bacterium MAG19_C2-C3]|nr:CRTAC1 family protein [Pyrinomonadaceae bacterium MAG19_C2-C3]